MIYFIKGKLVIRESTKVVIETNGIGYGVNVTLNTISKLPDINNEVFLYTLLIPKEDSLTLYGFYDKSERETFQKLISISGIGPKIALGILSSLTVEELQQYVFSNNLIALSKLPGVGKKTAERLVFELKDKISSIIPETSGVNIELWSLKQEAILALTALGYNPKIAEKCVKSAIEDLNGNVVSSEILIKKSLSFLVK